MISLITFMYLLYWEEPGKIPIPHNILGYKKNFFPVHSLGKSLGSWGWSAHAKMCSDPHPLDFSCSVKNKWSKIISPFKMFHIVANTFFCPGHKWPFHGKEDPGKTRTGLDEECAISYIHLYMVKYRGDFPT